MLRRSKEDSVSPKIFPPRHRRRTSRSSRQISPNDRSSFSLFLIAIVPPLTPSPRSAAVGSRSRACGFADVGRVRLTRYDRSRRISN